jgi:hypothetical protein
MRIPKDLISISAVALVVIATSFGLTGCGNKYYSPPPPLPDDRQHVQVKPKTRNYSIGADLFDKQVTTQMGESLDLSRQLRNLFRARKEAYNVDAFDNVPNSSWFTNRNATTKLSTEQISRGPDLGSGPDIGGKWLVTRAKGEGVTPGFSIKDEKGNLYLIKFDPIGFSELVTGAEVVSTKLFYAAGYHVPENYITYFHPKILVLGDDVKFTDEKGRKRAMTEADLEELLDRVQRLPDGRIRALASKYIPGEPIGPFSYRSIRKDDPNDIVPHYHRRELRGLRVMSAWLNHVDTKSGNSLDTYVTEDGVSYVRHYLIDFGTTLGSAAHGPMKPQTGHENQFDPHEVLINCATLGLYVRPYERLAPYQYASVGLYESELFDPGGFKFSVPNPAFESCTNRDGFWGAKLVMSFTDEQLRAVVYQGQYSDPRAAAYLYDVLKERRDKTGRYWFDKINPLDNFSLLREQDDKFRIQFVDLAVAYGLESKQDSKYRYDLRVNGELVEESVDIGSDNHIDITAKSAGVQQWELKLETFRGSSRKWSKWVKVYFGVHETTGEISLLGIERQD